jgi:hypothetical protein
MRRMASASGTRAECLRPLKTLPLRVRWKTANPNGPQMVWPVMWVEKTGTAWCSVPRLWPFPRGGRGEPPEPRSEGPRGGASGELDARGRGVGKRTVRRKPEPKAEARKPRPARPLAQRAEADAGDQRRDGTRQEPKPLGTARPAWLAGRRRCGLRRKGCAAPPRLEPPKGGAAWGGTALPRGGACAKHAWHRKGAAIGWRRGCGVRGCRHGDLKKGGGGRAPYLSTMVLPPPAGGDGEWRSPRAGGCMSAVHPRESCPI